MKDSLRLSVPLRLIERVVASRETVADVFVLVGGGLIVLVALGSVELESVRVRARDIDRDRLCEALESAVCDLEAVAADEAVCVSVSLNERVPAGDGVHEAVAAMDGDRLPVRLAVRE